MPDSSTTNLDRLLAVMARLRDPQDGCPWDLEQDHKTLRPYLLEEAHEVLEAIDAEDDREFEEELGDLLLQIVFHARMAEEREAFAFDDVARGIADKLEERHPHIFADVEVQDAAEVARNWEAIKAKKKKRKSVLDGVPKALPSLARAARIQDKASSVGFDWENSRAVLAKVLEEVVELETALHGKEDAPKEAASEEKARVQEEFGDLLFTLVNWSRLAGLEPESALREATLKFEGRFRHMEAASGVPLRELDSDSLEILWKQAKEPSS